MQFSSNAYQSSSYTGQIRQLANQVRQLGIYANGEAGFAKMCMSFDFNLAPEPGYTAHEIGEADELQHRVTLLFDRLISPDIDAKFWQLAMVWLDGKGFGDMTIEQLGLEVRRIREKNQAA